jgi:hypothetical protein
MRELASLSPEWVGHGLLKRSYELRSGEVTFATLRWEKAFGSRAQAETAEATWTFKRVGFFKPSITVRVPDSEADLAVFHPDWFGNGAVEFPSGSRWKWKSLSMWRSRFGFVTAAGEPLIEFKVRTLHIPLVATVVVSAEAEKLAELPMLVTLGWYVTVLTFDDMSAAAAAGGGAG